MLNIKFLENFFFKVFFILFFSVSFFGIFWIQNSFATSVDIELIHHQCDNEWFKLSIQEQEDEGGYAAFFKNCYEKNIKLSVESGKSVVYSETNDKQLIEENRILDNLKKEDDCLELKTENNFGNDFYQRCYDEFIKIKCNGLDEILCEEKVNDEIIELGKIQTAKDTLEGKAGRDLSDICNRRLEGLVNYDGGICPESQSGFDAIMSLIQRALDWIIGIAYLLAVISIFWGGFLLLTANGDTKKMSRAKNILTSVVKGLIVITAAWLIVGAVSDLFLQDELQDDYKFIE